MKTKTLYRTTSVKSDNINEADRTVKLSFSSEDPYERYFGIEILDHAKSSVRLGRLKTSGALLVDHNPSDHVGTVEKVSINNLRGEAVVRFGSGQRASEVFQDVKDGIRKSISVGYRVLKMELTHKNEDSPDVYRVTDWEPMEVSLVSIPADSTVGIGRNTKDEFETEIINQIKQEVIKMTPEEKAKIEADAKKAAQESIKKTADEKAAIVEIQTKAREDEQDRIQSINSLGEDFKVSDLARQFVDSGNSLEAFREAVLDKIGDKSGLTKMPENITDVGMSDNEVRNFSFVKVINALSNPTDRGAQKAAEFEFECSAAAAEKSGKTPQGIMIPSDVLKRDLSVGTATAGGHLVSTDLMSGSFIDLLRNRSVMMSVATTLNNLQGNVAIPRMTGGATAYWVAEGVAPTESQQAFDQVTLSPNTVGAFTDYSRKLMLQGSLDVESLVRTDLATVLALEIDRVAINGSGSGAEPTGILNTTGIGSVVGGTNGLTPAWSHIVDLESAVANSNADIGSLRYVTNSKVRGKLKQVEKASGTAQFIYDGMGMNGTDTLVTNQVPSNLTKGTSSVASAILYGNFADLLIGLWGGLDLVVDPYTASTTGTVRVVALQDVDIAVRHAESFAAMLDALTA